MVDGSDAAYYEAGYFFVYATFKPLRDALNLAQGETTRTIYTTELDLEKELVGHRIGVPGTTWVHLPMERQTSLFNLVTEHSLASYKRKEWYDRFEWELEPFGPGNLIWELIGQLARSTGQSFGDQERQKIRVFVMAAMMSLDPHAFLDEIRDVAQPGQRRRRPRDRQVGPHVENGRSERCLGRRGGGEGRREVRASRSAGESRCRGIAN